MDVIDSRSVGNNTGIGADTAGVSVGKSNESSLSPSSSPGVLDLPGSTHNTSQEDSVVNTATAVVEHT